MFRKRKQLASSEEHLAYKEYAVWACPDEEAAMGAALKSLQEVNIVKEDLGDGWEEQDEEAATESALRSFYDCPGRKLVVREVKRPVVQNIKKPVPQQNKPKTNWYTRKASKPSMTYQELLASDKSKKKKV